MLTLIMPMAGAGTRFEEAGYTTSKPMIPVGDVPMFVHAERCIGIDFEKRIFIVRKEQNLKESILEWYPEAHVHELDHLTEGTACTILSVEDLIKDGDSILVANCDQHTEWDSEHAQSLMNSVFVAGLISVFHCPEKDPKWSFAETDNDGRVLRVAEKDPISEWGTTGYYYWKDGKQFCRNAKQMIEANDRVNNEFYTCPVYNYTIKECNEWGVSRVVTVEVDRMQGIGTPEDLNEFHSTQR